MDEVVSRILTAAKARGLDQKTLAAKIGVRQQSITDWKKGVTTSYTKYMPQISDLLGVSVDYLLTGENASIGPAVDPELEDAMARFGKLTEAQRAKVIGYMEGLLSQQK